MNPTAWTLFLRFCVFSLMAFGGANAVLPEIHRHVVEMEHWMSGDEFAALFAIAQAAPGPNVLIVTLLGWKLAGLSGALATTVGMCLPSSILSFQVSRLWVKFRHTRWRRSLERALAPLTMGLILGSSLIVSRASCSSALQWGLCGLVTIIGWRTKLNPVWMLTAGALVGMAFM